jgi:hypothetical protein
MTEINIEPPEPRRGGRDTARIPGGDYLVFRGRGPLPGG